MLNDKIKTLEVMAVKDGKSENFLDQIFVVAKDVLLNTDYLAAYRLAKIIDSISVKKSSDLLIKDLDKLENLNVRLKFLSLSKWPELVMMNLFSKGIGKVLGDEIVDIRSRLEAVLIEIPLHLRDEFKQKLLRRLSDNKEEIASIKIAVDNNSLPATIGNLIRDYLGHSKSGQSENIRFAQYIEGKTFQGLNDIEKIKVKELFEILNLLSRSSYDPLGLENAILYVDLDNKMKILDHGIVTMADEEKIYSFSIGSPIREEELKVEFKDSTEEFNLSDSTQKTDQADEVMVAYRGDPGQLRAITKETDKLTNKFGSDSAKLRQEFFLAVQKKNIARTIAILRLLVQFKDLENFMKEDERLGKFLAATWAKQYGQDFSQGFVKNPAQLKYVRAFLRYVLEQRLGMSANDAARVGLQIANIFVSSGKTGYNKMAYFDVADKNFKWFE